MTNRNDDPYFSGRELYGDDFTPGQIADWFAAEIEGYYDLATKQGSDVQGDDNYPYDTLNEMHAFRHLRALRFKLCVVLGAASGRDVKPIAPLIDEFLCVEPASRWWTSDIGGIPATYVAPKPDGGIDLPDGAADLVVSMAVLHHIPNVTAVLRELVRVLEPGGLLVLREPISSMGDWRRPRPGLTKNERGLPVSWIKSKLFSLGLTPVQETLCVFPPLRIALMRMGLGRLYYASPVLALDTALSYLMSFNTRYHRVTLWDRFAPAALSAVYRKR